MGTPPPLPKLFVSHIHEEAALAAVLKEWLQDTFHGRLSVFVSSDIRDNPGGKEWMATVKAELTDPQMRMLIVLLSPSSVSQHWILVEMGVAWALNRHVFPLCHSEQQIHQLPRPMADFGGASLDNEDAARRLVEAVKQATGLSASTKLDFGGFLRKLRTAARRVGHKKADRFGTAFGKRRAPRAAAPAAPNLPIEQEQLLQLLAAAKNSGADGVGELSLIGGSGIPLSDISFHISELLRLGFVGDGSDANGKYLFLKEPGAGWLIARGKMRKL